MIRIYGGTDTGRVRAINQDAFTFEVLNENTAYAVVCDGIGGEQGGHIASGRAVEVIGQALSRGLSANIPVKSVKSLLISALTAANAVVYEMAQKDISLQGMGTTAVAAVILDGMVCIAYAGDSRAYMVPEKSNRPWKLTRDHSVVQFLIDSGEISEKQARVHPKRNYITRAVGVEATIDVEYLEQNFPAGRLLLCTDGLYNDAPPEEHMDLITSCVSEQDLYLLIDEANKAGGSDNITAVVVAVSAK